MPLFEMPQDASTLFISKKSFRWLTGDTLVQTHRIDTGYDTAFCGVISAIPSSHC